MDKTVSVLAAPVRLFTDDSEQNHESEQIARISGESDIGTHPVELHPTGHDQDNLARVEVRDVPVRPVAANATADRGNSEDEENGVGPGFSVRNSDGNVIHLERRQ